MPRRPNYIWKGHISFGLVNIPVTLRSAENRASHLDFDLLDRRDMAPVGYRKVNKVTGKEVDRDDIVKGYEYKKGEYVVVEDEDFRRASVERTQRIDVVAFVEKGEIEPAFYERPYYLEPVEKNEKGYALFREALRRTRKVGVGKIVLHQREHVVALMSQDNLLVMNELRYRQELKDPADLHVPSENLRKLDISEKEIDLAEELVNQMADHWRPEIFHDQYQDELLSFIRRKAEHGETEAVEEAPKEREERTRSSDIMSLLKRSVEAAGRHREHEFHGRGHDGHSHHRNH